VPSDLEQQLQGALRSAEPAEDATARARDAALAAMSPQTAVTLGRRHRLALAIAIAVAAMAVTGVTLAASGTVREVVGIDEHHPPRHRTAPPPDHRPLPEGASGFATVIGHDVWVARPGAAVAHLRADAFELSPNAVYAAVGNPGRLVVLDPATMGVVKSWRVRGTVVAVAWAPIGIRIGYIVRQNGRYALHLIEGDLSGDTVVDRDVEPVTPAWRWDSLAFAYVRARGRVAVRDLEFARTVPVRRPPCASESGRPGQLAFAPHTGRLAVATNGGAQAWIGQPPGRSFCLPYAGPDYLGYLPHGGGLAWISRTDVITTPLSTLGRIHVGRGGGRVVQRTAAPAGLEAIAAAPDRRSLALAFSGHRLNVIVVPLPPKGGPLVTFDRILLRIPNPGYSRDARLLWR